MNNAELRYVLETVESRSGQKLAILMNGFFNTMSEENLKNLSHYEISWTEYGGELVPNLVTAFGPKPLPVPTDENEKMAQLYEELRAISLRYDVAIVTSKQNDPVDSVIEVKRSDPFAEMNSIGIVKRLKTRPLSCIHEGCNAPAMDLSNYCEAHSKRN